jgi:hypothetical protein
MHRKQTFAGLTIEELNAAGAAAGAEAVAKAHAAGVAVSGLTRFKFASGIETDALTLVHPNGTVEIIDDSVGVLRPRQNDAASDRGGSTEMIDRLPMSPEAQAAAEAAFQAIERALAKPARPAPVKARRA